MPDVRLIYLDFRLLGERKKLSRDNKFNFLRAKFGNRPKDDTKFQIDGNGS